ncbi:zinc finger BED domain-containing protein 4-like [Neoarius graeffei]|uniref:zinc finger BED domain-containing protein 4-like n=1 Tax=Neoarius graeffei TaxID=443677 RepID=UPI00298CD94F|nr:zinc finger BED domain-containing protein 4-like [Neoarius graeffei]
MIQSLLDQKRALGIYTSENEVDTLSANQWALLEKTAKVLAPFEELTRRVSSSTATAADIIPAITVLLRFLSRETDEDQGVRTMKGTLLAAVKARFGDSESNPNYTLAMLLDPRYKTGFFSSPSTAKELLLQKMGLEEMTDAQDEVEPLAKTPRMDQGSSCLDNIFNESQ